MTQTENAMLWLYCKSLGMYAEHIIEDKHLWVFGSDDLEKAIFSLTHYPEKFRSDIMNELKKIILEKFEDEDRFFKWSKNIFQQVNSICLYVVF